MPWTQFWDMHSGGGQKLKWAKIYIEAPEKEAISVFYSRFGRNPHRVTCTCCGEDYSITESDTLEEATAYHRGCKWDKSQNGYDTTAGISLEDYFNNTSKSRETALAIYANEITAAERATLVPKEGYCWIDGGDDE